MKSDPLLTQAMFDKLAVKLEHLKRYSRPMAAVEVARLAAMGDFSENAEYQIAKGRLRGINSGILKLEHQLNRAVIIAPARPTGAVQVGSTVTIESGGKRKTYRILGSAETSPGTGIISHTSPLGTALLGHKVGETVLVKLREKEVAYLVCEVA